MIWKPTKKALAKRREYIEREIKDAENARREAFERLAEAEQTKIDAYLKAQQIIDHAVGQAYKQKETIELEAKENLKKIQIDASYQVAKLKQSMQDDIEKQILDTAFNATQALLQKKINHKENRKLVQKFIKELNKNKGSHE
jgi:F-type H+-transporting ATPase subunit b